MPKIESGNVGLTDGRILKQKFLNGGYNIIPNTFGGYKNGKVRERKQISNVNQGP